MVKFSQPRRRYIHQSSQETFTVTTQITQPQIKSASAVLFNPLSPSLLLASRYCSDHSSNISSCRSKSPRPAPAYLRFNSFQYLFRLSLSRNASSMPCPDQGIREWIDLSSSIHLLSPCSAYFGDSDLLSVTFSCCLPRA